MPHALKVRDEYALIYGACAHCGHRQRVQMSHLFLDEPTLLIRCDLVEDSKLIPPNFATSPEACPYVLAMIQEEGEEDDVVLPE